MNSTFNRQFLMLDFDLLDDPAFIEFVKSPEYATYLILRRYVRRGGAKGVHFLDLQVLYEQERLKQLPELTQDPDKVEYIAQDVILARFQDEQSLPAYRIIAAKVPKAIIRQAIAEIDEDGAWEPVKAFMHRMKRFTERKNEKPQGDP